MRTYSSADWTRQALAGIAQPFPLPRRTSGYPDLLAYLTRDELQDIVAQVGLDVDGRAATPASWRPSPPSRRSSCPPRRRRHHGSAREDDPI